MATSIIRYQADSNIKKITVTGYDSSVILDEYICVAGSCCLLVVTIKPGLTAGWKTNITTNIPVKYRPPIDNVGGVPIPGDHSDYGKIESARLTSSGALELLLSAPFTYGQKLSFTYPIS